MTNPSKSTHFLLKVRNQVNKNREIEYKPQYHIFEDINHYSHTFQNVFFKKRFEKDKDTKHMNYCGPEDYPWENDTKCYFFDSANRDYRMLIFAIPHNWLLKYDPTIPIFIDDAHTCYSHAYYLDLEKRKWVPLVVYLIGDRFRTTNLTIYPDVWDPKPYSIGKGDEDWCITYLDWYPYRKISSYFRSFLLIKNIDFSEFDAKVKAKGLKCPGLTDMDVYYKNRPKIDIPPHRLYRRQDLCLCAYCRKDYRAIEVGIDISYAPPILHLLFPIK